MQRWRFSWQWLVLMGLGISISLGPVGCATDDGDDDSSEVGDDDASSGDDDSSSGGDDDTSSGDDDTSTGDDDSSSGGGDDDSSSGGGDDDDSPGTTLNSIFELNEHPPTVTTPVTVEGIVTAVTYKNNFWIQDARSGQYSGIYIFAEKIYPSGSTVPFVVGDKVRVVGQFKVYFDLREIAVETGGSVSLLQASVGVPPALSLGLADLVVNACAQGVNAATNPYLGVLVNLPVASVSSLDGACGTNATYGYWEIENNEGSIMVDDDVDYPYIPVLGDSIEITGVVFYGFNQYKIEPTILWSTEEVPEALSIYSLNITPPEINTPVLARGLVTGVTHYGDFCIQDPDGGAYSGIYVYDPLGLGNLARIVAGDLVELKAVFTVHNGLRELTLNSGGEVQIETLQAGMPDPYVLSTELTYYGCATYDPDFDAYNGVLVRWPILKVESLQLCDTFEDTWEATDIAGNRLIVNDDIPTGYIPVAGDVVSLTGMLKYTGSVSNYHFNPIGDAGIQVY